jgi:outer membrane receptor for ferrienterochelin and colicin
MKSSKHILFATFIALIISVQIMSADTLMVVRGYVYDAAEQKPVSSVHVIEPRSRVGTSTDINGFFSLRLPANAVQLRFSHVAYTERTVSITNFASDSLLRITLTKSDVQLDEVNVTSSRTNILNTTQMGTFLLSQESIKQIPTVFGEADVIKALQTQPGVSAGSEGLSGIYVRGGNEDENLIMLDGISLYKIMHLGGLFSAINVEAIQDVTFYKSSFPSRYGGRLSSVLDIRTRDGDLDTYHGSFALGLTSANVNLKGPISKDKTSFAASARRSWLEVLSIPGLAIINELSKSKGEKTFGRYAFTDANLKINHIFNSRSSVNLMFYYGNDYFKMGDRVYMEGKMSFIRDNITYMNWGNRLVAAQWIYRFSDRINVTVSPSHTHYASSLRKSIFQSDNNKGDENHKELTTKKTTENGINDLNGNIHFDYHPSERHQINFGAGFTRHRFLPEQNSIQTIDMEGERQFKSNSEPVMANEFAFYAEDNWIMSNVFRLNAGLRLSLFGVDSVTYLTLEPRVSLRVALSDRLSYKASYSRMNQFVQQISDSYISLPTDFWMPVNRQFKPLESDQFSTGFYYEHPRGYSFSVECYYKDMRNLLEYKEGYANMPVSLSWDQKLTSGKGRSFGAELIASKSSGKLTGLVGYGLMWSDRQFVELNLEKPFPAKYDNRHKINVVANYKFNETFELNGSWTYITGNRLTVMLEDYLDFSVNGFDPALALTNPFQDDWVMYYKDRNNVRLPAYHRLDLGLNIRHPLKNGRTGIWNISVWNAYNRLNPIVIRTQTMYHDKQKESPRFQTVGLFPLIPSISYTYKF